MGSVPVTMAPTVDRQGAIEWFLKNRQRSRELFDLLSLDAYYTRPIALRNPIVFYEGHLAAFNVNVLLKKGLRQPAIDEHLEVLFARGIDPEDEATAAPRVKSLWPTREEVLSYGDRADEMILHALHTADLDREDDPFLRRGLAVYTILEHEAMHQETLAYMWHRLPYEMKSAPATMPLEAELINQPAPSPSTIRIPAGRATLGAVQNDILFGWDNEFPSLIVDVPDVTIDAYNVTNEAFLEFVAAGGYDNEDLWTAEDWRWRQEANLTHPLFWERDNGSWFWRGMFKLIPLPMSWPVYVSQAEATAYARWKGKRLPTEAELQRATYGTPAGEERSHPWGSETPDSTRGNFDFTRWDPVPVGSHPAGRSAWGVHDLVGNGWEWTSTPFAGFPGFTPMPTYPEYSAEFFDSKHYVIKGASPVTAKELLRPSFRNWFRANYPYVYATFRCVS